ncbi:MAG: RluA family pseudouridine synthase [Chloroflexota bacterium]
MTLPVAYEDERLLAVNKPSGRLSVGPTDPADLSVQAEASLQVGQDLFIVHRLDRGTSGIILFAKDAETHRRLSSLFESREVQKVYLALVLGHVDPRSGEIVHPLRAFGSGRMGVDPRGRPSTTRYDMVERLPATDLVEVRPLTGRRHQIRVHLYQIGHPVLGDARYGDARPVGGAERLMLHAQHLTFPDADGEPVTLRAEPPEDFLAGLRAARGR